MRLNRSKALDFYGKVMVFRKSMHFQQGYCLLIWVQLVYKMFGYHRMASLIGQSMPVKAVLFEFDFWDVFWGVKAVVS